MAFANWVKHGNGNQEAGGTAAAFDTQSKKRIPGFFSVELVNPETYDVV
jgi:hypothetical protein